jgi:hypothetical protein
MSVGTLPAGSWACSASFCSSHQHLVVIVILAFDQWLVVGVVVVGQVEQALERHLAGVITFSSAGAVRRRVYPAKGHTAGDLNPDGKLDQVVCRAVRTMGSKMATFW